MPAHDWTLVDAGVFHSFHTTWIGQINTALNKTLLPRGFYALAEQHMGEAIADVLTLHASDPSSPGAARSLPAGGGTLVAEAPPRARHRQAFDNPSAVRPRTIAIRHVSGHQLVAMIEIVSPANKDRAQHLESFVSKAADALNAGVHLLVVDLFPPGKHDPSGIHGAIRKQLSQSDEPYDLPRAEPLTLAAYASGARIEAYVEHLAVGAVLPEMPLFLHWDRYINVPFESTYAAAYAGVPSFWREVIEKRATTNE